MALGGHVGGSMSVRCQAILGFELNSKMAGLLFPFLKTGFKDCEEQCCCL